MNITLEKGASFIWNNARLLDRAIFEYFFLCGSPDRIKSILSLYQNGDGGFGHALEPDLRAPDSHPLFVEFALHTLYVCQIHAQDLAYRVCDFLAQYSNLASGIPTIFPSSQHYPRAAHWNNPASQLPSLDRLNGLVGLVNWHGISHPWLPGAVEACLHNIASTNYRDAHTILTAFCLVESVSFEKPADPLFEKLSTELMSASFFCLEAPVKTYGLTPLDFAPSPASFCRRIFTESQINAHLEDLLARQQPDGGWPILWEPPSDMAHQEWRAQRTVMALAALRAYGRI
jgi:hypothetical protein